MTPEEIVERAAEVLFRVDWPNDPVDEAVANGDFENYQRSARALADAGLLPREVEHRRVFGLESVETGRPCPPPHLVEANDLDWRIKVGQRIERRHVTPWEVSS